MPVIDTFLAKNPHVSLKFSDFSLTAGFCVEQLNERMKKFDAMQDKRDFLNGFLEAKQGDPKLAYNDVLGWLMINVSYPPHPPI